MMMSRRVCFSPEASIYSKQGGGAGKVGEEKKRVVMKLWMFKLPKASRISVGGFFKNIGEKVARALPPLAAAGRRRCSCKVSSSASLGRSRSYAETLDSQRAQAIEDCIEFLNSSSSLQRSNSVSSSC
ncbi:uncharacterized protein LOC131018754 [Salvia miltiorrhiza]|uniref:uncharacterized protein LOC131018754 n=1 Tax=Salvia miltiorrhiza TaxID=226208 RepID=UPI0025AC6169|nr:uncharacterized protein LOC131018754 [Salvia miltiorrhiza]